MDMISVVAFTWGLLEASIFFIVPDVWLSWVVVSHGKRAYKDSVWALMGALVGGTLVYLWGRSDPAQASFFTKLPGIDTGMITQVSQDLKTSGTIALLFGPLKGIPYKLFAFHAAHTIGFIPFLVVSIPARLLRFLAVIVFVHGLSLSLFKKVACMQKQWILIIGWVLFYTYYFSVMP